MLTEDGSLHRFVNVYVNDDDVRYLDKLDTKLGPTMSSRSCRPLPADFAWAEARTPRKAHHPSMIARSVLDLIGRHPDG